MDQSEQPTSLGSSFQRLADTLLNTIRNRLELLGVEVEEEMQWFFSTLCWAAASLFLSFAAVLVVTFTTVVLVPEGVRSAVMIGFCALYLLGAGTALVALRRKLKKRPPPFQDTVAELRKDITSLKSRE